jgi:hypothetical protein
MLIADVPEQTSGLYRATLRDEHGVLLPGNVLNTLALTLYVKKADGTIAYVNSRNAQNVLNQNDVLVYAALQTDPDGVQFNLKWSYKIEDTTLVEDLPFERHIALFEFSWPRPIGSAAAWKHELILNVQNLGEV